jgi:hypothetical protein
MMICANKARVEKKPTKISWGNSSIHSRNFRDVPDPTGKYLCKTIAKSTINIP